MLPRIRELVERALSKQLLPRTVEKYERYIQDLRESKDLQKDLYIRVLEEELAELRNNKRPN